MMSVLETSDTFHTSELYILTNTLLYQYFLNFFMYIVYKKTLKLCEHSDIFKYDYKPIYWLL